MPQNSFGFNNHFNQSGEYNSPRFYYFCVKQLM